MSFPLDYIALRFPRTVPFPLLSDSFCRISKTRRFPSMASEAHLSSLKTHPGNDPDSLINYPVPLSPPLPSISKDIELKRALTASSKSSLFALSRNDVLFEDSWFIAVNKPQGVYCEALLSAVRGLLSDSTFSDQLVAEGIPLELHLANRLDRDTTGVTIITKSHKVSSKLVKAFTEHKIRKTYLAFCVGPAPRWEQVTVKSGHGRSKHGAWRVYAVSDVGRTLPGGSTVKDMETSLEVLTVNGIACGRGNSEPERREVEVMAVEEKSTPSFGAKKDEILIRAHPQSGRTHQIRLHCQYLGIPIRGDVKYEGVYEWKGTVYDGHELHAESLTFEHPVTGQPLVIRAPLPLWASEAIRLMSL